MPIDECASTFAELAEKVLPAHMQEMKQAMQRARQLADFCKPKIGIRTILKRLGRREDFSGCYVLLREKPFYVGVSRGLVGRLRQHGIGSTHFAASLAYRMACEKVPHDLTLAAAMKDEKFIKAFNVARQLLVDSNVAFIEIPNPLELHLFEAYCAMALDTREWNTFRTH
jgi:predicted GIY-YIG superfamily endonuclease